PEDDEHVVDLTGSSQQVEDQHVDPNLSFPSNISSLPSPALTARDQGHGNNARDQGHGNNAVSDPLQKGKGRSMAQGESATNNITESTNKESSHVWLFAEKVPQENATSQHAHRAYCRVKDCTHINGYSMPNGGTNNIARHLQRAHNITKENYRTFLEGGATALLPFTKEEWERRLCRLLVELKLPFTFVQNPLFKDLVMYSRRAPRDTDLTFPADDTMSRK
ncbi:hypothetical protein DFQ26_002083, partial [Actinomortierella ambigua]